jgi:hypothetical protein
MTVQDLGSIGEIIGAVAVLFTLVYLSLQTRQARLAAEETAKFSALQGTHSIVSLYVEARRSLLEHKELIAKANTQQELSEAERVALTLVFDDLFYAAAYSFGSGTSAGSVHSADGDVQYFTRILSSNPSAMAEWEKQKNIVKKMGPGFVERVDEAIAISSEATHALR